jgi:hypothetical protein
VNQSAFLAVFRQVSQLAFQPVGQVALQSDYRLVFLLVYLSHDLSPLVRVRSAGEQPQRQAGRLVRAGWEQVCTLCVVQPAGGRISLSALLCA